MVIFQNKSYQKVTSTVPISKTINILLHPIKLGTSKICALIMSSKILLIISSTFACMIIIMLLMCNVGKYIFVSEYFTNTFWQEF